MAESEKDRRVDFIREYTLTSMRLKQDKWNKIIISDEQRNYLMSFVDKDEPQQMVISQNIAGHLQIHIDWPSPMKNKGVFFVKKEKRPIPEGNIDIAEYLAIGDVYPNVLDHLCSWVEEVLVPIFNNEENMKKFPKCVAYDIKRQMHELATAVYQIKGHIKGRTLLPFPQGASNIDEEEKKVRESDGKEVDTLLKNNIEAIVSKWAYQIDEVLSKDSAEELDKGNNPGPMTEIQFWKAKCENLESLYDQMKENTTKKMASILNITDSAYYPSFKNVLNALNEALDITLHLHPLIEHFQGIEVVDFPELRPLLAPLMHSVCLVYANSSYYNTTARIIVLMQETCNLLIDVARRFLDPASIFQIEVEEALDNVKIAIRNLKEFKTCFQEYKQKLPTYYPPEVQSPKLWEFQELLVFKRFDSFLERLHILMDFFNTAVQLLKLEKVEIGGIRGKALTSNIYKVYEEFKDLYSVFSLRTYDSLDPKDFGFLEDNEKFNKKIATLDRKLGAILSRAFDDCIVSDSVFKLLHIFGSLVERPLIGKELNDKMPKLVEMINAELDEAKQTFDKQEVRVAEKGKPLTDRNMPPIAGQLNFALELKHGITNTINSFKDLDHPIVKGEDAAKIMSKFNELLTLIGEYEENVYMSWALAAEKKTDAGLRRPLLVREPKDKTLKVNFGKEIIDILSEVRNLRKDFPERPVPQKAGEIFRRFEDYRKYNNSLEQLVHLYNYIKLNILPEELKLIERELADIDKELHPAENELTWKSENIWDYIDNLRIKSFKLNKRVKKAQVNLLKIEELIYQWHEVPLFGRVSDSSNQDRLLNLAEREEKKTQRYDEIKKCSEEIQELLKENEKLFLIDVSVKRNSRRWRSYLGYVDEIVQHGLLEMVASSVGYLLTETDKDNDITPLFTVKLELFDPDIIFKPSLDKTIHLNFFDTTCSIIDDVFNMVTLVPRIALPQDDPDSFLDIAFENEELADMKKTLISRIESVMELANEEKDIYMSYSNLWIDNIGEYVHYFLNFSRQLTEDEQLLYEEDEKAIKKCLPTLSQFKDQINHFEGIYEEVMKIPKVKVFNKWFKVEMMPFKCALQNIVKRWSWAFKEHLLNHVIESLQELEDFIQKAFEGLSIQLEEGDYDNLIKVMEFLQLVRDKQPQYDELFEPLKEVISVINIYEVDIPEKTLLQLQELPEKWAVIKRMSVTAKQAVIPLQGQEVGKLKARIDEFFEIQKEFRRKYQLLRFFSYNSKNPYELLSAQNLEIEVLELEVAEVQAQAGLFEVTVPDLEMINQCRLENKFLKMLWDYIFLVRTSIDEWKTTAWKDIDVENMDMECKKFVKDIRGLDKTMRSWHAYLGLDTTVKNMITSIRAVGELQNPAIRERHWDQLVQATKVRFTMSDDVTLADLLSLNLHNFEDDVNNIVDKACKEMAMEKMLKDLRNNWKNLEFDYEAHSSGYKLLRASEELITTLEENTVQVQNMMSSKYIAFFLTEMTGWQKTLGLVDSVFTRWSEVQRVWAHLQSIFLGSEDIRIQLPEDTKRFDHVDKEFKVMMKAIEATPNVVQATNNEALPGQLDDLQRRMTLCEKALSEYLETKRLAFPRFYFASSADLLDILSNGHDPSKVSKHLTKLFDSVAKLRMVTEDEKPTKYAYAMVAKDGEEVSFVDNCSCNGQVESWLNNLLDSMRITIRNEFKKSMTTYLENPRDRWLMMYPAQVALAGTQIWWTYDVSTAFSKLEEGYENALKDYYKRQISQLNALIVLLLGKLTKGERQKVMTICTIDVHSRDTVSKLISQKVDSNFDFSWQSQLRHRWDYTMEDCYANICDAEFRYSHEYLGNTPRLVITPLTDRCYITLTQSLHLIMGGAPQGPAGTGKTETTKDLGRAIGIMVYVFNCSEQMDYKSCGNIFKGLAQTGAWGCFDEFNRITVEVLSVIAVQVKCIQDAIREKREKFSFMNALIPMNPTIGYFITMNPGYAGRAELPENLKVLFRPCAMCVPDLRLICEIMLVAEGFLEARSLSNKFITLYSLCKELLSKQDHYDWGLRAIKSVLVVAGSLKRAERDRPEDQVLMRALRDFNTPKIITEDMPVFLGLIADLFPNLDVPRKRDPVFEKSVKMAACDLKLQPEENFIMKVCQFDELLTVRHSVFIVGDAGTGKTQTWKTLVKTYENLDRHPLFTDLNPKAVTNDELYGYVNAASREWKDGLFSNIMRDLANLTCDGPKWIILDGDIDPMWIESLNTVMDDNKILTLASNERIAVTPDMRLIFEISNLRTATPATVSRAGILYINPGDLGWNPYVTSWVETREDVKEKATLTLLFDKYIPICIEIVNKRFRTITPIPGICYIQMLCTFLESLIVPKNIGKEPTETTYEMWFVFALVWSFGSALFHDGSTDYKSEFSKWFTMEFKNLEYPAFTSVFDVFVDPSTQEFTHWTEKVPKFELDPDMPLQACLVHNSETIRIRFLMDILIESKFPVMLIGLAGSGKTLMMNEKLGQMSEDFLIANVPFNFYYSAELTQKILEKQLEKKAGKNYGPPGTKTVIYFLDDLNMPEVDPYGTAAPHTLIRQHIDYGHWYDRNKFTQKDIHNSQYVACMNPTAGSFTINPRLQRHFATFSVVFPGQEALLTIYESILTDHLENPANKFPYVIKKLCPILVNATISLHVKCAQMFSPTAVKFHYIFNLRDLSNVFQGILFSTIESITNPVEMARLWVHETQRVYKDKLAELKDVELFDKTQKDIFKKTFDEMPEPEVFINPLIFCHFSKGIGEPKYMPIPSWEYLNKILTDALKGYNELNAAMDLVLFEDAMAHICRINRILESPRANALLVGVGGSGKQSLSRLASYISSMEVFQITLSKGYGIQELKNDLSGLYNKTGLKNLGTVFLMSDAQVADERFLVLINNLLASGEIPDLFSDDEVDNIVAMVKNEVKGAGIPDTRENCWKFFIDRVRKQLKVILCFSPVGSTLRIRGRKFPALVNCTCIDWFHEWPEEALISVSMKFLNEEKSIPKPIKLPIGQFMAYVHQSVNEMSKVYAQNDKRFNYTTPKSFLEMINLYSKVLKEKNDELVSKIERLENGLEKLRTTGLQVEELKKQLAIQEIELAKKNAEADHLIHVVGVETENCTREKAAAEVEKGNVAEINVQVSIKQADCAEDLKKAEPALFAAQEALNTLNKGRANLTELKSFGSPPPAVLMVTEAVMVLLAKGGKIPKDKSWAAVKIMMAKVDAFLDSLVNYEKENIHANILTAIEVYIKNPNFNPEFVKSKSAAAAGLCSWVINILKFYEVYCDVAPKRQALEDANKQLSDAQTKLQKIIDMVASLEATLVDLTNQYKAAMEAKVKCQAEADATNATISLANRLVGGLASEKIRWGDSVAQMKEQQTMLPGDVLLVSSVISYLGCFTKQYRVDLLEKQWIPGLKRLTTPIPMSLGYVGANVLSLLTDDAMIASWNNEGLPSDSMSTENATILTNSVKWPLMIDPQLQGIKWIKNRYSGKLTTIRLDQKGYMETIEICVSQGKVLLIENMPEEVEPVLDPLLGRQLIKKGKAIKLGDKEVEFNSDFQLYLHCKLANPHYKPELQAQTTLINFTVTRSGLEDQLLAEVVKADRPDLEEQKAALTRQQNEYKILLKSLEDDLLQRLNSAGDDILSDSALVENLESTKKTAAEIEIKVNQAKVTSVEIDKARELYRPAAARASLLYFILNDLNTINPMYQFSLKAFSVVFDVAIQRAVMDNDVDIRVQNLIASINYQVFIYTTRGLFECDKLIFTAQMAFQILLYNEEIDPGELDFLLRLPTQANQVSPVEFITNNNWGAIKNLVQMENFRNLDRDFEHNAKRWKKFVEAEAPEKDKLPGDWNKKEALQRLCIMRCLRSDRMIYAIQRFIEEKMGKKYVDVRQLPFEESYQESGSATPMFFILSPGVDPLKDVEALGKKLGYIADKKNFHNISLGQGQEVVAEEAMKIASAEGHWVVLQNIHLVKTWLPQLEKEIEKQADTAHENYRLFLSADPAPNADSHIIPQSILETSIKITNEPPTGIHANLHKALDNFNQETLEMCTKEAEFKSILFSLCYFHAVVAERRKFGPQGWNSKYPFNTGDLVISVNVLYNYLEANNKVPWEDLRYLFGEIMYGGHITDDWDRRLCKTYLEEYMHPNQLDGELLLAPGFNTPPNSDYLGYHNYINLHLPPESPYLYGLHPNAEIGFLTATSEKLFKTVFELQPRDAGGGGGVVTTREEKVKAIVDDILDKIPDQFNMVEIMLKVEERTPYVIVAFQECERMNNLMKEMKRSLRELDLGLKGELTISSDMEDLSNSLFFDQVPPAWTKLAYASMHGLSAWYADLLLRIKELENWTSDFNLPHSVWLPGFFNPQSFLTAIMQSTARKNELPLDKMCLTCEVTKKTKEEMTQPVKEGACIHGLFMEGARWDVITNSIANSRLKELHPMMPVIWIKAVTQDKQETRNLYECPVYKTRQRGPTYIWTFNLKTREKPAKWVLAGVSLLLQI